MPYITEELYQKYFKKYEKDKSIHLCKWPRVNEAFINNKIEKIGDGAVEVIGKVRQAKAKHQKSLKAEIILSIEKHKLKELKPVLEDLKAVTAAKEIRESEKEELDIKFL